MFKSFTFRRLPVPLKSMLSARGMSRLRSFGTKQATSLGVMRGAFRLPSKRSDCMSGMSPFMLYVATMRLLSTTDSGSSRRNFSIFAPLRLTTALSARRRSAKPQRSFSERRFTFTLSESFVMRFTMKWALMLRASMSSGEKRCGSEARESTR